MVTSMLAVLMARKGYKVGILDADITGPSIPKSFGVKTRATQNALGILPAETKTGIKIISVNMMLEDAESPVVWRGPVIAGAVKQFWQDVIWGELDYLFVDCPPGTGDVPLTVFQSIPVDGIIIVTSPQELVSMIVEKAVKMAQMMNVPVLGIVENMSYFTCPDCGKKHHIYGESHIDEIAGKYDIKAVAKLPIDSNLAACADKGLIEHYDGLWLEEILDVIEKVEK